MRICLVAREYGLDIRGGIATQTHLKAYGLTARGHVVHIITSSGDGEERTYQDRAVTVHGIPEPDLGPLQYEGPTFFLGYSLAVARKIYALEQERPFDIIQFPDYYAEGFVYQMESIPHRTSRCVIQLHGPLSMFTEPVNWPRPDTPLYKIGSFMEYSVMHHSDCVLASSHYTAAFCATRYDYPVGDIHVIHSGIDIEKFSPRPRPHGDGDPRLLFVGADPESKGVMVLVTSIINLVELYPNIRLRIIGKGNPSIWRRLAKLIERANAQSNFELVGYVPYDEISEHYAWCDVFALPSIREPGPGNVYMEAMACGKPVIACTSGGAPEVVLDHQTGLLVAPRDPVSLEAAIVALADDPALRQRLGIAGRERMERYFSVEEYLNKVERIYEELLHPSLPLRIQAIGSSLMRTASSLEPRAAEDGAYPWTRFLATPRSSSTLKRLTRHWRRT